MGDAIENRTGLAFYIDNNIIGHRSADCARLRELHRERWIELMRDSGIDEELARMASGPERDRLLAERAEYIETLGPHVLDVSRMEHSVTANEYDETMLFMIHKTLFPDSDPAAPLTGRPLRKVHDAMHLQVAIRYGCSGFITRDADDILCRREVLMGAFGLQVFDPERAVAFAERQVAAWEKRQGYSSSSTSSPEASTM